MDKVGGEEGEGERYGESNTEILWGILFCFYEYMSKCHCSMSCKGKGSL